MLKAFQNLQCIDIKAAHESQECEVALHENPTDSTLKQKEFDAAGEYKRIHSAYISFLAQKAKINWSINGDENTTMFHKSIKARRLHNTI